MKWFMCNETERIPVKFPDVPAFISNAGSDTDDNQNHDIIQPSDNDGDNETPSATLKCPTTQTVSHASPTHALKREYTTKRAGRKVIVPSRFIDSVEFNNMRVKCEHCGVKYANRRNLKRHFNAVHSENVKYVAFCMHNLTGYFSAGNIY